MLYDISMNISGTMITWPGDPPPVLRCVRSLENGDSCNLTEIQMGVHTGTHLDAPAHFFMNSFHTDTIPLESLIGPCVVIEHLSSGPITKNDLAGVNLEGNPRILVKTLNSSSLATKEKRFDKNFIAFSPDAADYLVKKNTMLVGLDYLSIEPFGSIDASVHKLLLKHGTIILEGLDLSNVTSGVYELLCLPIKLDKCEGAPARAVLRTLA